MCARERRTAERLLRGREKKKDRTRSVAVSWGNRKACARKAGKERGGCERRDVPTAKATVLPLPLPLVPFRGVSVPPPPPFRRRRTAARLSGSFGRVRRVVLASLPSCSGPPPRLC